MRWQWTQDQLTCPTHGQPHYKTTVVTDAATGATEWVVYDYRCGCTSADFAEQS